MVDWFCDVKFGYVSFILLDIIVWESDVNYGDFNSFVIVFYDWVVKLVFGSLEKCVLRCVKLRDFERVFKFYSVGFLFIFILSSGVKR